MLLKFVKWVIYCVPVSEQSFMYIILCAMLSNPIWGGYYFILILQMKQSHKGLISFFTLM